jgi:hypothetical protein
VNAHAYVVARCGATAFGHHRVGVWRWAAGTDSAALVVFAGYPFNSNVNQLKK